jgi:hypothetical protein
VSSEIRDREGAEAWLSAGLALARVPGEIGTIAPQWIVGALAESAKLPPVGVVTDLGWLVSGRQFGASSGMPATSSRLRAAVRLYEDQVLGRFAVDGHLEAINDAIAKLEEGTRPAAVSLLVSSMLERVGFTASVSMSPQTARRVLQRPADELVKVGYSGLREAGIADKLADAYEDLVKACRKSGALLTDADVFTMENLAVLKTLTQRLGIEQIVAAAEDLSRELPRRMRRRGGRGVVHTQLEDESTYPIGGFSAMSTSGSMENLVSSELVYMDEQGVAGEVDLFDMRYAEGELLYYTRDEAVYVRARRVINFVLHGDLAKARFKDAGLRFQRLVIVFGMVLAAVRKLTEWLSEEGLTFRLIFVGEHVLEEERALAALLLREWIEKQMAEVTTGKLPEIEARTAEEARRAQVAVIHVAAEPPELGKPDQRVLTGTLDVGEAVPVLKWAGREPGEGEQAAWQAWTKVALGFLSEMV